MLSEEQVNSAWKRMVGAEVRSMYFAELTINYTKRKQILNALVLFLTSGAAVSVGARGPGWLTLVFSIIAAAISAYTIGFSLDRVVSTLTRLHLVWNELQSRYEHLWSGWGDNEAELVFEDLLRRSREASELGTEAPFDEELLKKWEDRIYDQYVRPAA